MNYSIDNTDAMLHAKPVVKRGAAHSVKRRSSKSLYVRMAMSAARTKSICGGAIGIGADRARTAREAMRNATGKTRRGISEIFRYQALAKPLVIVVAAAIVITSSLLAITGMINEVTIRHDGVDINVSTMKSTVGEALEHNGISVGSFDVVEPSLDSRLSDGMNIVIKRAINIEVSDAGMIKDYFTTTSTVGELFEEAGYEIGEYDEVKPGITADLNDGMIVTIDRIEHTEEQHTEAIPFETTYQDTSSLYKGQSSISVAGANGEKIVTETVITTNGEETGRSVTREEITLEPVTQVVLNGTKVRAVAASSSIVSTGDGTLTLSDGSVISYSRAISGTSTAYTYTGHNTATGTVPAYGTVAVDPSVIPLGTRMYITGYGYCVARDTGGAIKGSKVDVFFESYSSAVSWGRRSVTIYILN